MPRLGEKVPDAVFSSEGGVSVKSTDLVGRKTVVLFFYPKDDSPGCTVEACTFRDHFQDFVDAGAEVIGVSADDEASHLAFKAKHRLPYTLLTDPGGEAAKAFGVKKTFGLIAGRVTFVIDRQGVIQHRFDSQLKVKDHVAEALALVQHLERAPT